MKLKSFLVLILVFCLFISGCDYSYDNKDTYSTTATKYHQTEKTHTDTTKESSDDSQTSDLHEHQYSPSSCTQPKTCTICGKTSGSVLEHSFKNGKCSFCGIKDPNHVSEITVWIPTNGGTKYHSRSSCSNMKNPQEVTLSKAQSLGFTACKKCN
jgi:hypothetical protein